MSRLLVATAAVKLGADVDRLHRRVTAEVLTVIDHNRAQHLALSRRLLAVRKLRGKHLRPFLAGVEMPDLTGCDSASSPVAEAVATLIGDLRWFR